MGYIEWVQLPRGREPTADGTGPMTIADYKYVTHYYAFEIRSRIPVNIPPDIFLKEYSQRIDLKPVLLSLGADR